MQISVLIHVLGDPINALTSLMFTLASCQQHAEDVKQRFDGLRLDFAYWKMYTLIILSYEECGHPENANIIKSSM